MLTRRGFLAAALIVAVLGPSAANAADTGKITVFAAASLREAFEAAAPAFTRKTGIAVTFSFAGSDTLVGQLTQGAPADVFASANEAQMQKIVAAGLAAGDPVTFARNRLIVIVPKANPGDVRGAVDLSRVGVKVVLAAATVPVGGYARATFAKLNGASGFPSDFAAAVERNVVSNELDVKAVATKVALGEGDAGVVYTTDVTPAIAAQVDVLEFPPGAAPVAMYPVVSLRAALNPGGAAAFVTFITHEGLAFLEARGFLDP